MCRSIAFQRRANAYVRFTYHVAVLALITCVLTLPTTNRSPAFQTDGENAPGGAVRDSKPAAVIDSEPTNYRRPRNDDELRRWLENTVWHHRFTVEEIRAAMGLRESEIAAALNRFNISSATKPVRLPESPLLVLPYPGGRHPRIGFLDGAVRPQRETKVSVIAPWDDTSYVVLDVPEAIWSNLGLTYLAHTHIPTIWDKQAIALEKLEWHLANDGSLECQRTLPNGIIFGTRVIPGRQAVHMEMWLTNGSPRRLTDLRVQNCVMLKGARGFEQQTNDNKLFSGPYAACRSQDNRRWVITAWDPVHRAWGNSACPCLHSDPKFADCDPGETQMLRGWLSFYEGDDIRGELRRIEQTGWRQRPFTHVAPTLIRGEIIDAATGKLVPARVHIADDKGTWYLANSDDPNGAAVHYRKEPENMPRSREVHATLSPHPFRVELPPGVYTFRVERGKEYHPVIRRVDIGTSPKHLTFTLRRWIDMASRGWYSGETHVHRTIEELPNVMLAEDLNVAFPLSYWVRESGVLPASGAGTRGGPDAAKLIPVDPTHVICPMNTEYEIFQVGARRHTLGAVFVLNHQAAIPFAVPPVGPLAAKHDVKGRCWTWTSIRGPGRLCLCQS